MGKLVWHSHTGNGTKLSLNETEPRRGISNLYVCNWWVPRLCWGLKIWIIRRGQDRWKGWCWSSRSWSIPWRLWMKSQRGRRAVVRCCRRIWMLIFILRSTCTERHVIRKTCKIFRSSAYIGRQTHEITKTLRSQSTWNHKVWNITVSWSLVALKTWETINWESNHVYKVGTSR